MASPGIFPAMAEWHPTCESLRHLKIPKPCSLLHASNSIRRKVWNFACRRLLRAMVQLVTSTKK
jgi:hypothetical protein